MNVSENWNDRRSSDRGLTEIAILLTLLIFVAFGFVFYYFYQKVTELSEQVATLQQQVGELGRTPSRGEKIEETGEFRPVYTEKWAPSGSSAPAGNEAAVGKDTGPAQSVDGFEAASSVSPKEVSTLSVRPDGTIIDAPKSTVTNKAAESPDLSGKTSPSLTRKESIAAEAIVGDLKVRLQHCEWKELYLFCDLRIRSATEAVRDIQISNQGSFVSGKDGAVYRVSSFRIGVMGDRQNYRSTATISRSLPLEVQFAFYLPNRTDFVLKEAQFSVDGQAFVFRDLDRTQRVKLDEQKDLQESSFPVANQTDIQTCTIAGFRVDLLECGAKSGKLFCDVRATNVGAQDRSMMIEHDGQFARDRKNGKFRSTSFEFSGSQFKRKTRTTVPAKRGMPRTIRFWFNGSPLEKELHLVHFNLARTLFVFEYPKIDGEWDTEDSTQKTVFPSRTTSTKPFLSTSERKISLGDVEVSLQHCIDRNMYLYCDLELINHGAEGREILVSKDNAFARTYDQRSYRVTSFSVGLSEENNHHHARTFLQRGQPVIVRFQLYDPPSGISVWEILQFNIDGQNVVFEDVQMSS